jgi:tetratricopeptide (TPR) repeat protein
VRNEDLTLYATALATLRRASDWSGKKLESRAGLPEGSLSEYERGHKGREVTRAFLVELAAVMGYRHPGAVADRAVAFVASLRAYAEPASAERSTAVDAFAARVGLAHEELFRKHLEEMYGGFDAYQENRRAEELWACLAAYKPEVREGLVREEPRFRTAGLCVRLCRESERAAADDAAEAVALARLALQVAETLPERLQAYAWAFMGNALRVANDLRGADDAFRRAAKLRERAEPSPAVMGLIEPSLELELEASLRCAQRRLPEALELLERALGLAGSGAAVARILALRGTVLEETGDLEQAIAALRRALPLTSVAEDPRLHLVVRYNLAKYLALAGEHEEAAARLPAARQLCQRLGHELDLLRLSWLEGQLLASQGRRAEAAAVLDRVRQGFVDRNIPYDAALAALDLAVVYLEEGRVKEVKKLAREMAAIFRAVNVEREELASVRLFLSAAEREALTLNLARQAVEALRRFKPERGS